MKKISITLIYLLLSITYSVTLASDVAIDHNDKFSKELLKEVIEQIQPELWESLEKINDLSKIEAFLDESIYGTLKRELNLIPNKRTVNSSTEYKSKKYSGYGYTFELPWTEIDEMNYQEDEGGSWIMKYRKWGVVFENPIRSPGPGSMAFDMWNPEHLKLLFYNGPPSTKFEFVSAVLNANTSSLNGEANVTTRIKEKLLLWSLGVTKKHYLSVIEKYGLPSNSIYVFAQPNVKGFQIGNLDKSERVQLVLFPNDNLEINITILSGSNGVVTQGHIDFIIQHFNYSTTAQME